jgi:FkbM family methyltransferase
MKYLNNEIQVKYDINNCPYFLKHPSWWENIENYEVDTLNVIKKFSNKNKNFIDVGGWYGFMSIYGSHFYKSVSVIEGDPVSVKALKSNLDINECNNVNVIDYILADYDGIIKFGGNGELGNAESSILINNDKYLTDEKAIKNHRFNNEDYVLKDIIESKCITIKKLVEILNKYEESYVSNIELMKIDIEGGERIILKELIDVITNKNSGIKIFISLHWIFLTLDEIKYCVSLLNNNFNYLYDKKFNRITPDDIIKNKIHDILCTNIIIE